MFNKLQEQQMSSYDVCIAETYLNCPDSVFAPW